MWQQNQPGTQAVDAYVNRLLVPVMARLTCDTSNVPQKGNIASGMSGGAPAAAGVVGVRVAEGGDLEAQALQWVDRAEVAGQVGEVGACDGCQTAAASGGVLVQGTPGG